MRLPWTLSHVYLSAWLVSVCGGRTLKMFLLNCAEKWLWLTGWRLLSCPAVEEAVVLSSPV